LSRIARAVFRLTRAFGAEPSLSLTQREMQHLTELDLDELGVVIDAMMAGGVLARSGSAFRAGRTAPVVAATGIVGGPPKEPAASS
jgi:hypothetical protein